LNKIKYISKKIIFLSLSSIMIFIACFLCNYKFDKNPFNKQKHYVIIGCSAAGFYAAKELVKLDKYGLITCIGEDESIYKKTSLKSFIKGTKSFARLNLRKKTNDPERINFLFKEKVVAINRQEKMIILKNAKTIRYDKLLIATGAKPRIPKRLAHTLSWPGVVTYNNKNDVDTILLRTQVPLNPDVVIMGAGIRSLELADAIKKRNIGANITIINRTSHFLGDNGDNYTDQLIKERLSSNDINFLAPVLIKSISKQKSGQFLVDLDKGQTILADLVIYAMGTAPRNELAKRAKIALNPDGGVNVDDKLKTNDLNIFAAGDVVSFKNSLQEQWVRNKKWSFAKKQGKIAARNMWGLKESYRHLPTAQKVSFFGMKAFFAGEIRNKSRKNLISHDGDSFHFHGILQDDQIISLILLWDEEKISFNLPLLKQSLWNKR
jgi:NAD(P)H-nitrite reductase large subunit